MAGGSGTRLWPISRDNYPKQFLKLFGENSLMKESILRNCDFGSLSLFVNSKHLSIVKKYLKIFNIKSVVEPFSRGTLPCAIISSLIAIKEKKNVVVLSPSDLHIIDSDKYRENVLSAAEFASKNDKIVMMGITPTEPEESYGYMKLGRKISGNLFEIERFVEKPNRKKAAEFLKTENYLWNSGVFIFNPKFMIEAFKKINNKTLDLCIESLENSSKKGDKLILDSEHYEKIASNSIDYGIIEKTSDIATIKADFGWSDLGTWKGIWSVAQKNNEQNVLHGNILTHNTKNCYIKSNKQLIATIDVENLSIIINDDVVLISSLNSSESIRNMVHKISKAKLN